MKLTLSHLIFVINNILQVFQMHQNSKLGIADFRPSATDYIFKSPLTTRVEGYSVAYFLKKQSSTKILRLKKATHPNKQIGIMKIMVFHWWIHLFNHLHFIFLCFSSSFFLKEKIKYQLVNHMKKKAAKLKTNFSISSLKYVQKN